MHRTINNTTAQAGWRTYRQRGIHDNYTNILGTYTYKHPCRCPNKTKQRDLKPCRLDEWTTTASKIFKFLLSLSFLYWFSLCSIYFFQCRDVPSTFDMRRWIYHIKYFSEYTWWWPCRDETCCQEEKRTIISCIVDGNVLYEINDISVN
jgi:hypothetical protein